MPASGQQQKRFDVDSLAASAASHNYACTQPTSLYPPEAVFPHTRLESALSDARRATPCCPFPLQLNAVYTICEYGCVMWCDVVSSVGRFAGIVRSVVCLADVTLALRLPGTYC